MASILALPAHSAASLLPMCSPELSTELGGIGYSSSITVGTGLWPRGSQSLPPGFGFLVPAAKAGSCWPQRSCTISFRIALRKIAPCCAASSQAATLTKSGSFPTTRWLASSAKTCRRFSDSAPSPLFARVYKWKSAMAQYGVGHLDRLERIDVFAGSCRGWPWRAMAIAASASPTASAPVARRCNNSYPDFVILIFCGAAVEIPGPPAMSRCEGSLASLGWTNRRGADLENSP